MLNPREAKRALSSNSLHIRQEAVINAFNSLQDLGSFRQSPLHKKLVDQQFGDIVGNVYEFQMLRMNDIGWQIDIDPQDQEKYHLPYKQIDSMPEHMSDEGKKEGGVVPCSIENFFTGVDVVRHFVAGAFLEETELAKSPPPELASDEVIDAYACPREHATEIKGSVPGMKYFILEDLMEKWQHDNPDFYQAMIALKDGLVQQFTRDTLSFYPQLDLEYIQKIEGEIRQAWDRTLTHYAARTYAWFTPEPPELLEAPVATT